VSAHSVARKGIFYHIMYGNITLIDFFYFNINCSTVYEKKKCEKILICFYPVIEKHSTTFFSAADNLFLTLIPLPNLPNLAYNIRLCCKYPKRK
jgi:hypothetical protein